MATESEEPVTIQDAKSAVLAELVRIVDNASVSEVKELALAYRLLAGGTQPGASVVTGK